jgi:NhaA family Na+:H+ antiporter
MIELVNFFKVERNLAVLLLLATMVGLAMANFGAMKTVETVETIDLGISTFSFTLQGWIYNFGIPAFFALIGLELRREFHTGIFQDRKALLAPVLSAVLGVAFPAALYLAIAGVHGRNSLGWPIPTATDVTFALAVYMLFGKKLPRSARVFLLAFAIIDDVIGILIITFLYSGAVSAIPSFFALMSVVAFAVLGLGITRVGSSFLRTLIGIAMVTTACLTVYLTLAAGIQPTIAGVLLGLLVPVKTGTRVETAMHPWIAGLVLPAFAFMAAAVPVSFGSALQEPVFWAILTRPIGKVVGITLGAYIAYKFVGPVKDLPMKTVFRVSFLGGIGFTVSLLFCQISFTMEPGIRSAATAATLVAAAISAVAGAIALKTQRAETFTGRT